MKIWKRTKNFKKQQTDFSFCLVFLIWSKRIYCFVVIHLPVLHLVLWYLISSLFNRANSLNIEIKLTKNKVGDLISTKIDLISSMI